METVSGQSKKPGRPQINGMWQEHRKKQPCYLSGCDTATIPSYFIELGIDQKRPNPSRSAEVGFEEVELFRLLTVLADVRRSAAAGDFAVGNVLLDSWHLTEPLSQQFILRRVFKASFMRA